MAASGGASSISVVVRLRPFTVREAAQLTQVPDGPLFLGDGSLAAVPTPKLSQKGIRPVIKVVDDKCLVFDPPEDNPVQRFSRNMMPMGKRVKDQTFGFDRVFDENTTQGDVYEATTKNLLDSVLDGYNATVFAYGATGCGKTHTITGTVQQPGVIFLTMQELFERISERTEEKVTEVSLSYLEIYNETIRDLLVPGGSKAGLMLREDANQAVSVAGLSSHHPQNVEEVMDMIMRGNEYRTMSPTEANATSSRSHAVLQINVSQKDRNADVNEPHTMATLSIIDLAGSERASATKNRGERLIEGANINKSLLALGSCINALCDPRKRNHVPYRNSKLTRLLKFSLGGNCKTVMIVCVSPSSQHFDETQNTLRYANRAKNIQTKVTRNVYNVNRHVKDFLVKIDEQMALINELKQQQKDYEGQAFVKFRKQNEKREIIAREGVARIRNAYDHSATERLEKAGNMKKLRQIERRIAIISSWIAAFDHVFDAEENEHTFRNLAAMRKTAQGILVELEGSRHHYHQRLAKSNWERAIESALQNGLRQLKDADGGSDGIDAANLTREAELLKANADREALMAVAEQEKGSDAAVVQVLLQAHFETMAAVQNILSMDEQEAVEAAKDILSSILNSCTKATSHIIKPDGSMVPVELFPPTRSGTPKRKKQAGLLGGTPLKTATAAVLASAPHLTLSPVRASPKRRKAAAPRKGVSFTPKNKSPGKGLRRGVRWRDDTKDGTLAEFEKTPQRLDSTPEVSAIEPSEALPPMAPAAPATSQPVGDDTTASSPIPPHPEPSIDVNPKSNRFKTGFLAKKTDGSPLPPTITSFSSDSDHSPLRDLEPSTAGNRSFLQNVQNASDNIIPADSGNNSSSDGEDRWKPDRKDAMKVRNAIKRASSVAPPPAHPIARNQRRRSQNATSAGSPPNENAMFTASHARRMVKSEKENEWKGSVLSPRTAPIVKGAGQRRTTLSGAGPKESSGIGREAIRLSTIVMGSSGSRPSLMAGGKGIWR
ncbi:MAG: kinesin family [Lasallia pustulata]|uniref:Kinesin family n=1 Tax=Lasallia pustulata TaxID=136370 RepID=A0A5M8Q243_9LECA|nr:MAG: kinesin family [Lasallia pustulata]